MAALATVVALAVVVLWRTRTQVAMTGGRQTAGLAGRASLASRARTLRALGLGLGGAAVWGLTVPATLSPWVPWQLRPQWLTQVSEHRASYDIARQWLSAVHDGDVETATRLAVADPATVVGPLRDTADVLEPATAAIEDGDDATPGQALIGERASPTGELTGARAFICLAERNGTWRVVTVRSQPDCPAVLGRAAP